MLLSILLFFDFSGGEFLLIAVVFLMFFGSKSIPGMARALGKAVRDFKEAANSVQREIHESATIEEVKKPSPSESTIPQQTAPPSTIPQETTIIASPKPEANSTTEESKPLV
jgi:TatA/E family protein of Tat protein translocase